MIDYRSEAVVHTGSFGRADDNQRGAVGRQRIPAVPHRNAHRSRPAPGYGRRLMELVTQSLVIGLTEYAPLVLAAIGFALLYRLSGLINVA